MKNYLSLLLSALFFSVKLFSQTWTSHNASTVGIIMEISFPTNDSGYVITDGGQIRKTVNGALSWTVVSLPPKPVYSIFFTSGQIGFAYGDSLIYKTTTGGASWSQVLGVSQATITNMFFPNALTGYACSIGYVNDTARLYKTIDGGNNWMKIFTKDAFTMDQALYFFNSSVGFWATNFNIFSTSTGGSSFSSVYYDVAAQDDVWNMNFPNVDTGYAVGINNLLLRSTDGGTSWSATAYPGASTYDLYFFDGRKGFACGGNGFSAGWVQQTSNSGASWTPVYTSPYSYYCMDFPSNTVGYVGGDNGTVLKFAGTPTGIVESENQHFLNIYPNPTIGIVNITNAIPSAKISLLNLAGQIIKEQTAETTILNMNLENIAAGIYFIEMENAGERSVQKIIVQ